MILPDGGIVSANQQDAKAKVDPQTVQGWMHPIELAWLAEQASKCQTVVEVGSWKGRTTAALLNACPGTVWAVDHFKGSPAEAGLPNGAIGETYDEFMANVGHYPNLCVLRMPSVEASHRIVRADMIFLDADHQYESVLADLKAWAPKAGKLLCGHDRDWPGVERALKDAGIVWTEGPGVLWRAVKW